RVTPDGETATRLRRYTPALSNSGISGTGQSKSTRTPHKSSCGCEQKPRSLSACRVGLCQCQRESCAQRQQGSTETRITRSDKRKRPHRRLLRNEKILACGRGEDETLRRTPCKNRRGRTGGLRNPSCQDCRNRSP